MRSESLVPGGWAGAGKLFARARHEVFVSGSREPDRLEQLTADTFARSGSPGEAVEFGEVVFFSVLWPAVDELLAQTGSLAGKIVIDTTNQFVTGEPEGGVEQRPKTVADQPGARARRAAAQDIQHAGRRLPARGRGPRRRHVPGGRGHCRQGGGRRADPRRRLNAGRPGRLGRGADHGGWRRCLRSGVLGRGRPPDGRCPQQGGPNEAARLAREPRATVSPGSLGHGPARHPEDGQANAAGADHDGTAPAQRGGGQRP